MTTIAVQDTLVGRAASGDHRAFAAIVQRNTGLLRATAIGILRSPSDADDAVQEAFIAAWTHLDVVVDGSAITSWLVTTVRRRCFDRLRSNGRLTAGALDETVPAPSGSSPTEIAERILLVEAVQQVLEGLPPMQRWCWELRHLEQRSYDDIAVVLGVTRATVRGLLARARTAIDEALADWR